MGERRRVIHPKRGDIFLVTFDPSLGAEIRNTRPALVIQNDIANRRSPVTIVAAITSRFEEPLYPTEVRLRPPEGGLTREAVVLLNQFRTIDRRRLVKRLGRIPAERLAHVDRALQISLGLVAL